jgi:8-oxo-dGTP pyrophosphatase MutT (NUDIX family)
MGIKIIPIAGTDFRLVPGNWPMPDVLRAEVPAAWARLAARNPHVWDGRILGFTPPVLGTDGILRAEAREDAYSAFLTWRDAGFPDIGTVHAFGTALIVSKDGALIFGVMGKHTVNAGRVYPPGGSLEPGDLRADGSVDVEGCIARELLEETGLDAGEAVPGPLLAIFQGPRLCISRAFHFDLGADDLVARIRESLDAQEHRELADVVACRTVEDGRRAGALADYAAAILEAVSAGRLAL